VKGRNTSKIYNKTGGTAEGNGDKIKTGITEDCNRANVNRRMGKKRVVIQT
jgi:hypothetical protein